MLWGTAGLMEFADGARRSRRFNVRIKRTLGIFQSLPYNRSLKRHKCRAPCAMEPPKTIRRTPPKNLGLLELIRAKRERDWKSSADELKKGFRGWHQRDYLPHFDAPFVTFQLPDSFPVTRRTEFETILKEPDNSVKRRKLEAWLDRGHGECWLRRWEVAEIVGKILLEADGRDYRMQAWVVMPRVGNGVARSGYKDFAPDGVATRRAEARGKTGDGRRAGRGRNWHRGLAQAHRQLIKKLKNGLKCPHLNTMESRIFCCT